MSENILSRKSRVARVAHNQIEMQIAKGLKKYGGTLDDNIGNLTAEDLIQHGLEEMADGIQYLAAAQIRNAMERDVSRMLSDFVNYCECNTEQDFVSKLDDLVDEYLLKKGL